MRSRSRPRGLQQAATPPSVSAPSNNAQSAVPAFEEDFGVAPAEEEAPTLDAAAAQLSQDGEPGPDDVPPPVIASENATEVEEVEPEPEPAPQAEAPAMEEQDPEVDEDQQVEAPAEAQANADALASLPQAVEANAALEEPPEISVDLSSNLGLERPQIPSPAAGPAEIRHEFEANTGFTPESQAAASQGLLDDLRTDAGSMQAQVADSKEPIDTQIQTLAQASLGRVDAEAATVLAQVQGAFEQASAYAAERATQAVTNINAALELNIANIDGAERGALAVLDQALCAAEERLAIVATDGDTCMVAALTTAAADVEQIGVTKGQQAVQMGGDRAGAFRGRNNSDKLERKRDDARAKAAGEVADGYRDSFIERANQTANELRQAAGNMGSAVSEGSATVAAEVEKVRADGEAEIRAQAEHAREQARIGAEAARAAAFEAWTAYDDQIRINRAAAVEGHETTVRSIKASIRSVASEASAEITGAIDVGLGWFEGMLAMVATAAASDGDEAGPDTLAVFVAQVRSELESGRDDLLDGGAEAVAGFGDALTEQVDQAIGQLRAGGAQMIDAVAQSRADYDGALTTLAGDFARETEALALGAAEGVDHTANQAGTIAEGYVDTFEGSVNDQVLTIEGEMTTVRDQTGSQFDNALGQLNADIDKEAEAAAKKIQPWWKKALATVVSIVVAVVVFVAVAAFCIATLGTGLVVAGLIAGGIAGVAALFAADVVNMATGVQDGFSSFREYAAAAVCGAVGGAVGGFTAGMAPLATGLIAGFATGITDSLTQVLLLGQEFSWARFGVMTIVSGLTAGLLTKFVNGPAASQIDKSTKNWNLFQRAMGTENGATGRIHDMAADKVTGEVIGATVNSPAADAATPDAPETPVQVDPQFGGDRPTFDPETRRATTAP